MSPRAETNIVVKLELEKTTFFRKHGLGLRLRLCPFGETETGTETTFCQGLVVRLFLGTETSSLSSSSGKGPFGTMDAGV